MFKNFQALLQAEDNVQKYINIYILEEKVIRKHFSKFLFDMHVKSCHQLPGHYICKIYCFTMHYILYMRRKKY